MGKKRSVANHILYRLKAIEDKLDGLSYKMREVEMAETKNDISNEPSHSVREETNTDAQQPQYLGIPMTHRYSNPYYPWMQRGPNPYYSNRWAAPYQNPSNPNISQADESQKEETKPILDVGTLISLMNDPLIKQVIGYFRNKK